MRHFLLLMATSALLIACASKTPEVKPTDNGRYTVTAQTRSHASNGQAIARHEAVRIADKFCATKERAANAETFDDSTTELAYVSTLVFSCR